jgi:hypothetical protein
LPRSNFPTAAASPALQVSFFIGTDLLSLLEPKQVPPKLAAWVQSHEAETFLSVVSFAELQFGLDQAPATHRASLDAWLADIRVQ